MQKIPCNPSAVPAGHRPGGGWSAFKRIALGASLLALGLFSGCASAPTAFVEHAPLAHDARVKLNLETFDEAWRLVDRKYFDPKFRGVNWRAMRDKYRPIAAQANDDAQLYATLNRMCAELRESHLAALAPRRAHEIKTERKTAVGMGWVILEGRRVVTEVIPGGPAADAGVETGWIIVSRDGQPMELAEPHIPQLGQPVTYGFVDLKNQPRTIEFKPKLIAFEQEVSKELAGGYRYLRFDHFDREALHWLSEELKAHRDAPGVVLDLRENPGGYVLAFEIAVAEFFSQRVPTGTFVSRNGREKDSYGKSFLSAKYPGKVVILTSGATGSAAEIFTHVMQHTGRATVIGRRTAGAVIVARNYPLPGGGSMQVPIQDYRGLDGKRLEGRGVIPDIGVPLAGLDDVRAGNDPDVEAAVAALGVAPSGYQVSEFKKLRKNPSVDFAPSTALAPSIVETQTN